ncbi:uncharacterized protein LOC144871456 [Branchiostoma floridae x Branchiostoma japonicum]
MEPYMLRYVLKLNDRVARGLAWQHYEGRKTARMSIRPSKPAGKVNFTPLPPSTTQTPGFSGGERSVARELLLGLSASPALQTNSDDSGDDVTSSESSGSARCRGLASMTVCAVQPASRNHFLVIPDTSSNKRPAVSFGRRRSVVKRSTRGDQRCETTGGNEKVDLIYMDGCRNRQKRRREEDDSEVSPCAKRHLADVDYDADDESN